MHTRRMFLLTFLAAPFSKARQAASTLRRFGISEGYIAIRAGGAIVAAVSEAQFRHAWANLPAESCVFDRQSAPGKAGWALLHLGRNVFLGVNPYSDGDPTEDARRRLMSAFAADGLRPELLS